MLFLSLLLGSLACLVFPSTRLFGVLGGMLLFYLHPILTTVLALTAGALLYYFRESLP